MPRAPTHWALRWVSPAIGVVLFVAAVLVLRGELEKVSYVEVQQSVRRLPPSAILLSILFTAANYAILCCFDLLAFRYVGRQLNDWKVAATSFIGYAVANNVGFAIISGTSVRYRFYSRWGLSAQEISRIVVFYSGTFWLGFLVLAGWSMAMDPHPGLRKVLGPATIAIGGWALLAGALAYLAVAAMRPAPVRMGRWTIPVPRLRIVAWQYALSTLDWALAAGVLYALLPRTELTFWEFLSAFLAAQLLGLVSHVPGGVGVFEGTMVVLLDGYLSPGQIFSSLFLYRLIYYVLPLGAALAILVVDEVRLRRHHFAKWGSWFGTLSQQIAPRVLAMFIFMAGALLLLSGATPTEPHRLAWIDRHVPLVLVEAGYLIGSVAGVGLLIVSHGVARRLDMAFIVAATWLSLGIAASLLKGADYEEAALLGALLVALFASRPAFDRKADFWAARFSPGWTFGVVAVVGAAVWLGFFAFQHVEYSDELWWRFALRQDAPRALRATMLAVVLMLAFGVLRLLPDRLRLMPGSLMLAGEGEQSGAEQGADQQAHPRRVQDRPGESSERGHGAPSSTGGRRDSSSGGASGSGGVMGASGDRRIGSGRMAMGWPSPRSRRRDASRASPPRRGRADGGGRGVAGLRHRLQRGPTSLPRDPRSRLTVGEGASRRRPADQRARPAARRWSRSKARRCAASRGSRSTRSRAATGPSVARRSRPRT